MRDEPPETNDRRELALALIDCEIDHHINEACAHMHAGREVPQIREHCYRAGRVHGQRLRAWREVRRVFAAAPDLLAAAEAMTRGRVSGYASTPSVHEWNALRAVSKAKGETP